MARPHISTPRITENSSDSFRAFPSVDRMSVRDWRNLTYDSSIQILNLTEMDDTFLYGLRNFAKSNRDSNQTMSSISEYGPEVLSAGLMEKWSDYHHGYSRARHFTNHIGNISTTDILTNTWDNLKDARLVSYLKEINSAGVYNHQNPTTVRNGGIADCYNRKPTNTSTLDKHLHRNSYSESVLDLSKSTGMLRERSGSDVCMRPSNRKDNAASCIHRLTVTQEEPPLVQPLKETKYQCKIGPTKRIKLASLHRDTRHRKFRRNGTPRRNAKCVGRSIKTYQNVQSSLTQEFVNPAAVSTLVNTTLVSITNDCGSLSNFLMENETIPSINSATPIAGPKTGFCTNKYVCPTFTRTPSLRSSRPRSMATSDLREFKCKKTLDFNESFESEIGDDLQSDSITDCDFYEYETVLNLCTRKPRLGLSIKNKDRPVTLDKNAINDIKVAISKSNRRMNIRTNGTLNMLPRIMKTNSHANRSSVRKSSSIFRQKVNNVSSDLQFRKVFESNV